uniref:Uncharacterized protein n=1 Tax=Manihot esculenta TaxID=3983 RepID=A0A2C9U6A5_MANES
MCKTRSKRHSKANPLRKTENQRHPPTLLQRILMKHCSTERNGSIKMTSFKFFFFFFSFKANRA